MRYENGVAIPENNEDRARLGLPPETSGDNGNGSSALDQPTTFFEKPVADVSAGPRLPSDWTPDELNAWVAEINRRVGL